MNYVENTTSSRSTHGAPRTPWTQGLVERSNCTVKKNILNILKDRNESLGKWCTVLGEATYKNITLQSSIWSCVWYAPKERDTWQNRRGSHWGKRLTYNQWKRKLTHSAGSWAGWSQSSRWPFGIFCICKHRTTFCGWLTSGNFSLKPQQTQICHPWMYQKKPRIKKQSGGLQNWWICFNQNKQSWQNFATTFKCTAWKSYRSW